ncbi:MAG: DNA polymerase III subunit chi [Pseudomonadota bacterium]
MGAVYFYHLTRTPLEATLPVLLEKALAAGWRVAVKGTDADRLDWLDERLWQGDGFLPHGRSGGPHDVEQPVLLTDGLAANGATCVMAIDGADIAAHDVAALDRACILFDGNDPAAVEAARGQWRALTGAGVAAQYWSQESGSWAKKAEHPATS